MYETDISAQVIKTPILHVNNIHLNLNIFKYNIYTFNTPLWNQGLRQDPITLHVGWVATLHADDTIKGLQRDRGETESQPSM